VPPFAVVVGGILLPKPISGHPALELCNTVAGWNEPPERRKEILGCRELVPERICKNADLRAEVIPTARVFRYEALRDKRTEEVMDGRHGDLEQSGCLRGGASVSVASKQGEDPSSS